MEDMIKYMLNAIVQSGTTDTALLSSDLASYNASAYNLVTSLHTTAVMPVSSVVISIILVLELARQASRMEGDNQLGAKIIAGTMFKSALLVIAAQNAMLFLDAINEVATAIINGFGEDAGGSNPLALPDGVLDSVEDAGNVDKAGMMMLLIIPFLVAMAAKIIAQIMVILRFAEMYALTAFASLPIALIGHPDTKSMGVGYLQRYAAVALQGVTLILAFRLYGFLATSVVGEGLSAIGDGSMSGWIVDNYATLIVSPILLIFLVLASGRLAKAVVGQG